jgi:hypothetical protein
MTVHDSTAPEPDMESLFLLGGGRISRGLERFQLAHETRLRAGRVAALLAAVTWLPLLLLAAVDGVAWGDRVEVTLLKDFLPHGQFLLVVPALVLGELLIGRRLGWAAAELRQSGILSPEDRPALDRLLASAARRWRGRGVNSVLLLLTLTATGLWFWRAREWLTGGWQYVGEQMTLSGWWYSLISVTVLRFLMLLWLWRLLLWAWVLWRTARLNLRPQPTHPDRAGGLAFLGAAQTAFGLLVFAFGVQLSCALADAVLYQGADLMAFRGHVTAFVLMAVTALLLPLLPFAPGLVRARETSLVLLRGSGYRGAERVERQLREGGSGESLGEEISAQADLGELYANARWMKPVPLELQHIFVMVLAALLPFLPLVFLVIPAQEVFQVMFRLVM